MIFSQPIPPGLAPGRFHRDFSGLHQLIPLHQLLQQRLSHNAGLATVVAQPDDELADQKTRLDCGIRNQGRIRISHSLRAP